MVLPRAHSVKTLCHTIRRMYWFPVDFVSLHSFGGIREWTEMCQSYSDVADNCSQDMGTQGTYRGLSMSDDASMPTIWPSSHPSIRRVSPWEKLPFCPLLYVGSQRCLQTWLDDQMQSLLKQTAGLSPAPCGAAPQVTPWISACSPGAALCPFRSSLVSPGFRDVRLDPVLPHISRHWSVWALSCPD